MRCPSGGDDECATHPAYGDISSLGLKCMSGVADCKNEMGLGAYGRGEEAEAETGGGDASVVVVDDAAVDATSDETTADEGAGAGLSASDGAAVETADAATTATAEEGGDPIPTPAPTPGQPLQGPFVDETVRIILYGLNASTFLVDADAMDRWRSITETYIEDFFNSYPTTDEISSGTAGTSGSDDVRSSVFDVSVSISGEVWEMAPEHDFDPLVEGEVDIRGADERRNLRIRGGASAPAAAAVALRRRRAQVGIDPSKIVMVTYSQTSTYRSSLDVVNDDDPIVIMRRPLETPEYRADYVVYMRSMDFTDFGGLEYVSNFMFTEFPSPAPTTLRPTESPVTPGEPTMPPRTDKPTAISTPPPTENYGCNLCRSGQVGVNADVILNGEVRTCMDVYSWFLENYRQGSLDCQDGQSQLNSVCCLDADGAEDAENVQEPVQEPAETPEPSPAPSANVEENEAIEPAEPAEAEPAEAPVEDELGLPEVTSLAETFFCGASWDSVSSNCETATPCPSGDPGECPSGEQCIAYTNCGGKFSFASDPTVEGGGPNIEEVKSTFFCGTSMQFLEMECDGATPCPNGPEDCEGDGEKYGCFAFTGCNEEVDPGSFVGFLSPPDEEDADAPLPELSGNAAGDAANFFYCAVTWEALDSKCVDDVPEGATPCPSGDMLECADGEGCFAFACNGGAVPANTQPVPSPSSPTDDYSVDDVNVLKSTFFCGVSIEKIDGDCENAIACPTGDECPQGQGCFAFSKCGGVDIDSLVSKFGDTDRPTRAPTEPVVQVCDEEKKMSVNVGYWQSWSI